MSSSQAHWDGAYADAETTKLGWYQAEHEVTISLFEMCDKKTNRVIDVGAGVTTLIDALEQMNYQVSVLDVSREALRTLKSRHGNRISYLHGDLTNELQLDDYDIWHDRAVLHFLLEEEQNDKPTVLALREIAEGHLDNPDFHRTENDLEKELAEELAKAEDEIA